MARGARQPAADVSVRDGCGWEVEVFKAGFDIENESLVGEGREGCEGHVVF